VTRFKRILRYGGGLLGVTIVLGTAAWFARYEIIRVREDLPPFSHSSDETEKASVAMRDGIVLATTVYRPVGKGPWPAILIRNPYAGFDIIVGGWCELLVRYGYACVYQDVRGQGESEGEWQPLIHERDDGIDTLAWLTAQDFQNGNLAMMGPSYLAAVQWAVAGDLPPEVKTLVPAVFTTKTYDSLYLDGMFRHETFTAWSAMMPKRGMNRSAGGSYQKAIRHRPHNEVDALYFGGKLPWYQDWISNPSRSAPFWQQDLNKLLEENPARTRIPILMIGGWYDVFLGPQFEDWKRLASRSRSRFVIGPWTHIGRSGDALDTPNAGGGLAQWKIVLDWFGHHLKGEPLDNPPGVATYVMGENTWTERRQWPPETNALRLHLDGVGGEGEPNVCAGAGLSRQSPTTASQQMYRYDPDDPVPTRGGSGMLAFVLPGFDGAPPANVWQGDLCKRNDILSFTSVPLTSPLHIAGNIKVALTIASDVEDTAFTAKLIEVFPDGRAVNIRDGITSLAFRGKERSTGSTNGAVPLPYAPGNRIEITLELWPIEWKVAAGSRLRLDISSSDFPKYHAHPNRAGVWSAQSEAQVATQNLYTGPGTNSWLELPVVAE
jgi:putative CocE/NonD family hydrolase